MKISKIGNRLLLLQVQSKP